MGAIEVLIYSVGYNTTKNDGLHTQYFIDTDRNSLQEVKLLTKLYTQTSRIGNPCCFQKEYHIH